MRNLYSSFLSKIKENRKYKYLGVCIILFFVLLATVLAFNLHSQQNPSASQSENKEQLLDENSTLREENYKQQQIDQVEENDNEATVTEKQEDVLTTTSSTNTKTSSSNSIIAETKNEVSDSADTTEVSNNACSESAIASYRQIINTSQSSITSAQYYISNPTYDNWEHNPERCAADYLDCYESADEYLLQATGYNYQQVYANGCYRTGKCSIAIEQRQAMINTCTTEKATCLVSCDAYLDTQITANQSTITSKELLINQYQGYLKDCGY